MSSIIPITVTESELFLRMLFNKCKPYQRSRVKMLLLLAMGTTSVNDLAKKTKSGTASIRIWKLRYNAGGIEALLADRRGADKRSGITAEQKQKIAAKLSNPTDAFRSYVEAQVWLKTELGIEKEYHAVNKYLKRNFGTKLKVGRKSHVKKDEAAVAVFKKPTGGAKTY